MGCHALLQGSSLPRLRTHFSMSPALAGGFFTTSTIWEAQFISLQLIYLIHSNVYFLLPYPYFSPPFFLLPTGNQYFFFPISVSLFLFCYIHQFVLIFRFHIQVITYSICMTYSTKYNILWVHPFCSKWQNFIHFFLMSGQYSVVYIYHNLLIDPQNISISS